MRFNITLRVNAQKFGNRLPINYQYEMSAAIYKILSSGSDEYAQWLHDNGFKLENGKQFKLFTFSHLNIPKRRLLKQSNQLELLSDHVFWQITFLPEHSTQNFIGGLFQDRVFEIGNKVSKVQFEVENIELLPPPEFQKTMVYKTLSPISVSYIDDFGRDCYPQSPEEFATAEWVRERLLCNLLDKYSAICGNDFSGDAYLDMMMLSPAKSSLITIKSGTQAETKVRGFSCNFALNAPPELQRIAYESGLGELNSQGFGCLALV